MSNYNFLDDFSTDEKIVLFETLRDDLNLKSIQQYAKDNNVVYNTAKTRKPFVLIGKTKYICDVKK